MPHSLRNHDAIVWISGATEGIGLGLARNIPYADARIVNLSRRVHSDYESRFLDLADPLAGAALETYFETQLRAHQGCRAIFIQNAHMRGMTGFAGEVPEDAYRRDIVANVAAPLMLGDAYLRAVVNSGFTGEAGLVMMSSAAARSPYEGQSVYCAGKAALEMWVRVVRRENQRRGRTHIWVTAVRPGFVDTALTRAVATLPARDYPVAPALQAQLEEGDMVVDIDTAARRIWAALPSRQSLLLFGEQVQAEGHADK